MVRIRGTVIAGVYFFPPQVFLRQEPCGQKREALMVVPADPIANLILGKTGPCSASLSRARACRVRKRISRGTPHFFRRFLSFAQSLFKYNRVSTRVCSFRET